MLKSLIKSALTQEPVWRLASLATRPAGVTVLMYHRIPLDTETFPGTDLATFRRQMRWLRSHCTPIAPDDIDDAARRCHRWSRPAVLVSFDDGYRDYHDHAYPVLADERITSVVFLATGSMDRQEMIWTDDVTWVTLRTRRASVELPWAPGTVHAIGDKASRDRLAVTIKAFLKNVPNVERLDWLRQLYVALDCDPRTSGLPRQMLDWDEVRATTEYTVYGGHTHNHPILSQLEPRQMADEIRLCRDRIVAETGVAPRHFAYPNGRARDFNATTQALLREHGFTHGYATVEGLHHAGADPLAIQRQHTGAASLGEFALRVLGR